MFLRKCLEKTGTIMIFEGCVCAMSEDYGVFKDPDNRTKTPVRVFSQNGP